MALSSSPLLRLSTLPVLTLLLCLAGLATAQSLTPANATSPTLQRNQSEQVGVEVSSANGVPTLPIPKLIPLLDGATDKLPGNGRAGNVFDARSNNVGNITSMNIAWISCDPSDYTGNLDAVYVLQRAVENQAVAAILYSKTSSICNYTAGSKIDSGYPFLYSTSSARDSFQLSTMLTLNADAVPMRATINLVERLQSDNSSGGNGGGQSIGSTSQPGGPSPSTAVAMIILYSITGVITALFLIIIITGAIRAHRHPERYGPRAVLGRARQSRAKGLARAMLDSIPIVKFGDNEGDVPKPPDVELAAASSSSTHDHAADGEAREGDKREATTEATERRGSDGGQIERTVSRDSEDGIGADVAPPTKQSTPEHALACSICTEEFERGEDVRVLPCNHKFHPACIDPWLLNVSGTCPLCRIDLRPPTATDPNDPNNPENPSVDGADDSTPNPQASAESVANAGSEGSSNANLQPAEASRRQSRRLSSLLFDPLNRRRMQDATPEERIQALRDYNARRAANAEGSRRRRISARFSNAFGRRTDESSAEGSRSGTPNHTSSATTLPESTNEGTIQAPMLSPLSFEERVRGEEAHAAQPVAESDDITPAPEIRVQAPDDERGSAEPVTSKKE